MSVKSHRGPDLSGSIIGPSSAQESDILRFVSGDERRPAEEAQTAKQRSERRELDSARVQITTHSPEETQNIGSTLGAIAQPGDIFLLAGDLGSGKTTLTQGVLWGLGGDEYARSPTFVLISQYEARLTLYHIDLYRLDTGEEVYDLGLDEYVYGDGLCVVEWADKAPGNLAESHLSIRMDRLDDTTRRLSISASAPQYERYLSAVRSRLIEKGER